MYKIHPSIVIWASIDDIWNYLVDIESWWIQSNPEHELLEILSNEDTLQEGTQIRIKERIAGIPGNATGEITEFSPNHYITWESRNATYQFYRFSITVEEGVTWILTPKQQATELTAHVWASFPETPSGRLTELIFKHILNGVEKDRQHAMQELEYIKQSVESESV